jgi:hypothetical protein
MMWEGLLQGSAIMYCASPVVDISPECTGFKECVQGQLVIFGTSTILRGHQFCNGREEEQLVIMLTSGHRLGHKSIKCMVEGSVVLGISIDLGALETLILSV